MKLTIEALGVKAGGTATVLLNLLREAVACDQISEITILASPAALRIFEIPQHKKIRIVDIPSAENFAGRMCWAYRGFDWYTSRMQCDAFLAFTAVTSVRQKCASFTFIQQSLPYSRESLQRCPWSMRLRMAAIRWLTGRSVKVSDCIFVQSEAVRDSIMQAFDAPANRIAVFMPNVSPLPRGKQDSPKLKFMRSALQHGPTLLYVGSDAPHKNLSVVAEGLQRIPEEVRPSWHVTLSDNASYCRQGIANSLGVLNREELHEAYQNATLVVLPSLTETVGLPMLEAMQEGIPVLAADRPYAHAVCEDAAVFFDPLSPDDFAEKAKLLLADAEKRAGLIARGHALTQRRNATNPYREMVEKMIEVAKAKQFSKIDS